MNRLYLKIPTLENLKYRKEYLSDSNTMSYNIGYQKFDGYNPINGTINFTEDKWEEWLLKWTNNKERFFAYLVTKSDDKIIGNVAFHYDSNYGMYMVEILIIYSCRQNGYSIDGLKLLCDVAFSQYHVNALMNQIPIERISAIKAHKKMGFIECQENNPDKEHKVNLLLSNRQYKNIEK